MIQSKAFRPTVLLFGALLLLFLAVFSPFVFGARTKNVIIRIAPGSFEEEPEGKILKISAAHRPAGWKLAKAMIVDSNPGDTTLPNNLFSLKLVKECDATWCILRVGNPSDLYKSDFAGRPVEELEWVRLVWEELPVPKVSGKEKALTGSGPSISIPIEETPPVIPPVEAPPKAAQPSTSASIVPTPATRPGYRLKGDLFWDRTNSRNFVTNLVKRENEKSELPGPSLINKEVTIRGEGFGTFTARINTYVSTDKRIVLDRNSVRPKPPEGCELGCKNVSIDRESEGK